MAKSSRDDTLRKGFQRIQESNRNAFEHSGQQQLKRMPNGQQVAPFHNPSPHSSVFNDYNKQPQMSSGGGIAQAGYRASAYPINKDSPREHVKMRHDPRLGQQPRIGIAGVPAAADYRRHSRPISHHQAVGLINVFKPTPFKVSPVINAAVPHLAELANNDRKRREKVPQNAHLHQQRDSHHRSGSGRDHSGVRLPAANGNHLGSSHLARVSASIRKSHIFLDTSPP